ncbi:MAG: zinc ABC transporter substrate-binding protein [Leptolyngbyaceae cyanobacterium bins.302]|nr:zinc ABC transporter substrate-binding protein [Leptolyngbyaceae cyanobacterium bins.302]
MQAIDAKLKQAISAVPPENRYIVSCEGAFSYLARDYGLKEVYTDPSMLNSKPHRNRWSA